MKELWWYIDGGFKQWSCIIQQYTCNERYWPNNQSKRYAAWNDALVNGTPALVFKIKRGIPAMHQIWWFTYQHTLHIALPQCALHLKRNLILGKKTKQKNKSWNGRPSCLGCRSLVLFSTCMTRANVSASQDLSRRINCSEKAVWLLTVTRNNKERHVWDKEHNE